MGDHPHDQHERVLEFKHASAAEYLAAFGRVVVVTAPGPVREAAVQGFGASGKNAENPNHLMLSFVVGEEGLRLEVDVRHLRNPILMRSMLQHSLTSVTNDPLWPNRDSAFPLTLTLDRTERLIPLDGSPHPFLAYTLNEAAVAMGEFQASCVFIKTHVSILDRLALRSLNERELDAMLAAYDDGQR